MNTVFRDNRRFNSLAAYFKEKFGSRVQKVSINAGFSCPNRDGKLSTGGCSYCNNKAFNPSYCKPEKSISQQIIEGIEFHKKRYESASSFLAYFQAFSNTYSDVDSLEKIYKEALSINGISGLIIGTRPDCINNDKLEMIAKLAKEKYLVIEYGIESCYNKTLERINRGHTFQQTIEAIIQTNKKGILTGGHMVFGLPGETRNEMLNQAEIISSLPLHSVKFHQLQIFKNTKFEKEFISNPQKFNLFDLEEYIEFIIDFTERLNPDFLIERFAGEGPPIYIAGGKRWGLRNDEILNKIEKRMHERETWQGKYFSKIY
ncbi:MAG: TIGR01212 family radical SAM protein [Bacteroidales bacterium]|nr:TIGR01212 family radical SAM protein [Bacteroidales bacterium]